MQAIDSIGNHSDQLDWLVRIFKAISDPARVRILNLLLHAGELCNCHIEEITGFSNSKISRHFSTLWEAELIKKRRDGTWIYYSMNPPINNNLKLIRDHLINVRRESQTLENDLKLLEDKKPILSSCLNC